MIKIERYEVFNLENALRGMRNPLNSWVKSDSVCIAHCEDCVQDINNCDCECFVIGEADMGLCKRLVGAGTEHRKFLRQIMVSVDITAPLYWWKEFDTYKVGTTANSCSTMHKIHSKEFTIDDFSVDKMYPSSLETMNVVIEELERLRTNYICTNDKNYWHSMIQLLPSSYNQMRTVTLNYEVLLNQYFQRNPHKLQEWHAYCDWIKSLPYMEQFIESAN